MRRARPLLAVLALAGCAARAPLPAPSAPVPATLPTRDVLQRSMAERRAAVTSLRSIARLRYTTADESRSAKQVIVAERPDRLRFEVLSPFGTVFVLAARDGRLAAYDRDDNTVYRGVASIGNLARYAQVDLPIALAVDLLLGTPPMFPGGGGVVSRDEGSIQLWQQSGDGVRVLWLDSGLEPIRYERRDAAGYVLLQVTYGNYAAVGGIRLPAHISLELPPSGRRIDVDLRDPEVNPPLSNEIFALQTPPGSKEVDMDQVAP